MLNDEKLVYIQSDMLLHESEWNDLREKVLALKDDEIHNFMSFQYLSGEVVVSTIMAITDTPDFSPHPTEILKTIRDYNCTLMNFKTLKQFLSL